MYIKKYDSKLIDDFINGKEINNYDLNMLHDNEAFMREVLFTTREKKYYMKCSDKLKRNSNFVIFVTNLFIDDEEFVTSIVDYFFNENDDELARGEMQIKLASLAEKYDFSYLKEYAVGAKQFYLYEKSIIEEMLNKVQNPTWKKELGLGFKFYMEFFNESNLITFYMACNILDELITNEMIDDDLHKKYNQKPKLDNINLYDYIVKLVCEYDHYLSEYLENNVHAMDYTIEKVKQSINDWDNYDNKKISIIIDKMYKYLDEQNLKKGKDRLLVYLVNKKGYNDKFLKNDNYVGILQDFYSHNPNIDYSEIELTPHEMILVNGMNEIVEKLLFKNKIKSKITYVDFSRNK